MKRIFVALFMMMLVFSQISIVHAEEDQASRIRAVIYNHIVNTNGSLGSDVSLYMTDCIMYYSSGYNLDPLIMTALFTQESGFNPNIVSSAGAVGLGQLMPGTAEGLGVSNSRDIAQNIEASSRYYAIQLRRFWSSQYPVEYALAAYNAGPNAVIEYNGFPPYSETRNYVMNIRAIYFNLLSQIS